VPGVTLNTEPEGMRNSYWMVTVVPDRALDIDKFALMKELDKRNVDSRLFFSRLSSLPAFEGQESAKRFVGPRDKGVLPSTFGINLPSGSWMSFAVYCATRSTNLSLDLGRSADDAI
jgi:perosamine synthetase